MILFLPPTHPTPDVSPVPASGLGGGPDGEVPLETAEVPLILSGVSESASFPAVLLALAGLGVSVDGRPSPTPPLGAPDTAEVNELPDVEETGIDIVFETVTVGPGFSSPGPIPGSTAVREPGHEPPSGVVASTPVISPDAPSTPATEVEGLSSEDEALTRAISGQVADTVTLAPDMLSRLSRDFVIRLERVAERMWNEHGLRVEIVEGFRPQTRQNELFAQGRTAPGPVVTWTTSSLHTQGAAADLYVDGAPVTIDQARLLARVAEQEGLRTLYPFDSGHIQLDRPGYRTDIEGAIERQPRPAASAPGAPPARGTARVAPVAPVARPARPGGNEALLVDGGAEARPHAGAQATASAPLSDAAPKEAPSLAGPGDATARTALRHGPAEAVASSPLRAAAKSGGESSGASSGDSVDATTVRMTEPLPVQPATTVSAPPRGAAPIGEVSEIVGPRPVDPSSAEYTATAAMRRLHLPIDGVPGAASIDLGLRGGAVDGWLNVSDPALAAELRRSLHELKQQLSERGVEARALGVRLVQGAPVDAVAQSSDGGGARLAGEGSQGQEAEAERQRSQRDRTSRDQERSARRDQHDHQEER